MTEHGTYSGLLLVNQFPELQGPELRLKETIENNDWHDNDSVYDHTISVFGNLLRDLEFSFISNESVRLHLNEQLNSTVGKTSRREILLMAAIFHDIAKAETIIKNENGLDACPNHEAKSAERARQILTDHNFDEADISRICAIVAYHAIPHGITNPDLKDEDRKKIHTIAKNLKPNQEDQGDIFLELMLLGLADTQGSQLQDKNAEEFDERVERYYAIIGSL